MGKSLMLSFAEELYLLALDEKSGKFVIDSKDAVLDTALTGAILTELSFLKKIDTDSESIYLIDETPTGNPALDFVLDYLCKMDMDKYKIYHCIKVLTPKTGEIENKVLTNLVDKKILLEKNRRFLWFHGKNRYPVIDNTEIKDVSTRLRELIKSDEIPDPREAVLVGLVNICGLLGKIFSATEMKKYKTRIETISKFELVNKEIIRQIKHIKYEQ
jgi:hypothetical protein